MHFTVYVVIQLCHFISLAQSPRAPNCASYLSEKDNSWQKPFCCPKDALCLNSENVCAPPHKNKIDCPSGGDQGVEFFTAFNCSNFGLYRCPHDPYCVKNELFSCFDCPNGGPEHFCNYCCNKLQRRKGLHS